MINEISTNDVIPEPLPAEQFPRASFARRFAAACIDFFIFMLLFPYNIVFMMYLFGLILEWDLRSLGDIGSTLVIILISIFFVLGFLISPLLIYVIPLKLWGNSLGKKVLGLKVVDSRGRPNLSWWQCLSRTTIFLMHILVLPFGLDIYLYMKSKQFLHDAFASTYVVKV